MIKYLYLLIPVFLTSCATVGAVIDGGKDLTTSVIDSTVKTAGNITNSALEDVAAVVDTVAESTENIVDNVVINDLVKFIYLDLHNNSHSIFYSSCNTNSTRR